VVDGSHRAARHGDRDEIRAGVREARAAPIPKPPSWLTATAVREWNRVAPLLHRQGLLTEISVGPLACYCQAYSDRISAQRQIKKYGMFFKGRNGTRIRNPAVAVANQTAKLVRDYCIEFGLTPTAAGQVRPPKPPGSDTEDFRDQRRTTKQC
jgi:P27 family predicted phage terminase small subunit